MSLFFYAIVNPLSTLMYFRFLGRKVLWKETEDVDFPYQAYLGKNLWRLRINDFPAEPLYTLFVNGKEVFNLDDPPPAWTFPHKSAKK